MVLQAREFHQLNTILKKYHEFRQLCLGKNRQIVPNSVKSVVERYPKICLSVIDKNFKFL